MKKHKLADLRTENRERMRKLGVNTHIVALHRKLELVVESMLECLVEAKIISEDNFDEILELKLKGFCNEIETAIERAQSKKKIIVPSAGLHTPKKS